MQNSIEILCTRSLNGQLIAEAAAKGIQLDVLSFIKTEPIESVEVQQEIESVLTASATVIFTSVNAVEAVNDNVIDELPEWTVYCVGNATQQLVKKYFPLCNIEAVADNAADLADKLIETSTSREISFFCGDQRRDELPVKLRQHDIQVNEIVVYQTILLQHKIEKDYQGILFFSPSAVESFFKKNKLRLTTIIFAIGITTASAIRKYANNKVLIADQPGKEYLVEKMIEYFT